MRGRTASRGARREPADGPAAAGREASFLVGLITPPYGLLLFVLANMTKQPLGAIVREAAPFIVAALLVLALITAVPDSILWLPRLVGYKG